MITIEKYNMRKKLQEGFESISMKSLHFRFSIYYPVMISDLLWILLAFQKFFGLLIIC